MEPAPRGTGVRVAEDSILDTTIAGSSGVSGVMHEECIWLTAGAGVANNRDEMHLRLKRVSDQNRLGSRTTGRPANAVARARRAS